MPLRLDSLLKDRSMILRKIDFLKPWPSFEISLLEMLRICKEIGKLQIFDILLWDRESDWRFGRSSRPSIEDRLLLLRFKDWR